MMSPVVLTQNETYGLEIASFRFVPGHGDPECRRVEGAFFFKRKYWRVRVEAGAGPSKGAGG